MPNRIETIFFDIGDTLGSAVVNNHGVLTGLQVYPEAKQILETLAAQRDIKLGIISNTGGNDGTVINKILRASEIYDFFDPSLLIYSKDVGITKDDPRMFRYSAQKAGVNNPPYDQFLFIGENEQERTIASGVGFQVAKTPQDVLDMLGSSPSPAPSISLSF